MRTTFGFRPDESQSRRKSLCNNEKWERKLNRKNIARVSFRYGVGLEHERGLGIIDPWSIFYWENSI